MTKEGWVETIDLDRNAFVARVSLSALRYDASNDSVYSRLFHRDFGKIIRNQLPPNGLRVQAPLSRLDFYKVLRLRGSLFEDPSRPNSLSTANDNDVVNVVISNYQSLSYTKRVALSHIH